MKHRWSKTRLTPVLLDGPLAITFILGQHALGYSWAGSGSLALRTGFTSEASRASYKIFSTYPPNSFKQYINGFAFLGMTEHVPARQVMCVFFTKAFRYQHESISLNPLETHTWPELARAAGWLSHSCKSEEVTLPSISLTLLRAFNISTSIQHTNKHLPVWKPCPPGNFSNIFRFLYSLVMERSNGAFWGEL